MLVSLLDALIDLFWTNERVGKYGEQLTVRELKLVNLLGRKGKILRNLYIPKDDGNTSEVDLIYITQKGIFVIESKNYSGWIFGNSGQQYWTQTLPNGSKNRFYNPIRQNKTHIKWLKNYLENEIPMFSFIVFSERCELKKVTYTEDEVTVIKRDSIYAAIRNVWKSHRDVLTQEEVLQIYQRLKPLTNADAAVKQAHIEQIRHPRKTEPEEPPATTDTICPLCGSELVLRKAKRGANAGNYFYGCSAFPKCRYIQNLEDHE